MVFSPSLPLPWWIILFSMYTPPTPDPNDTLYWKFKANGPKFPKEKLAETTKRHHPTKLPRGLKIGLLLPKMELISLKLPSKIHICDMWQDCTLQSVIGAANGQTKIQNAFGYWSILPKISRKKLLISLGVSWRLGNVQKLIPFIRFLHGSIIFYDEMVGPKDSRKAKILLQNGCFACRKVVFWVVEREKNGLKVWKAIVGD